MRELNLVEMENVSGAYSWSVKSFGDFLSSAVKNTAEAIASASLAAVAAGWTGSVVGGKHGGDGGGLLGIGSIGQGIGMVYGGIAGAIGGAVYGALYGWDKTSAKASDAIDSILHGSL